MVPSTPAGSGPDSGHLGLLGEVRTDDRLAEDPPRARDLIRWRAADAGVTVTLDLAEVFAGIEGE
jgi:hypothetical protein